MVGHRARAAGRFRVALTFDAEHPDRPLQAWTQGQDDDARCFWPCLDQPIEKFTTEVAFRKPILLPATVKFAEEDGGDGTIRFGVRDARKGTPHLDGLLSLS